jgi:hypothetical protein
MTNAVRTHDGHGRLTDRVLARALDTGLHLHSRHVPDGAWADLAPNELSQLRDLLTVAHGLRFTDPAVAPSPSSAPRRHGSWQRLPSRP